MSNVGPQGLTDAQLRASAVPVSLAAAPLPTGAAADGTDATGITPPTGAVGIRGWLSGIYSLLLSTLTITPIVKSTTGSITSNGQTVVLAVDAMASVSVAITGTFSATLNYEISLDGTNYVGWPLYGSSISAGAGIASAAGITWAEIPPAKYFRVRCSAFTSGTAAVSINATTSPSAIRLVSTQISVSGSAFIGDVGGGARSSAANSLSTAKIQSLATTNAANIKSSAARLYGFAFANTSAAWLYVHLYNLSGAPTVGTSTPKSTLAIPPGGSVVQNYGDIGIGYSLGLAIAITQSPGDTDATALSTTNQIIGDIQYA